MSDYRPLDRDRLNGLLVGVKNEEAARNLLHALFPGRGFKEQGVAVAFDPRSYQEARVRHSEIFDRYFLYQVPADQLSHSETLAVFGEARRVEELIRVLLDYAEQKTLRPLLNALGGLRGAIRASRWPDIAVAFTQIGDRFSQSWSAGDDHAGLWTVVLNVLAHQMEQQEVRPFLENLLARTDGLYVPMALIENLRGQESHPDLVSEQEQQALRAALLQRIRRQAEDDRLLSVGHFIYVLAKWKEYSGNADEVTRWLQDRLSTRSGWTKVFSNFVSFYTGGRAGVTPPQPQFQLNNLTEFLSKDDLLEIWRSLNVESPTADEKAILDVLQASS